MRVHVTTAYDTPWTSVGEWREAAGRDRFRLHTLANGPDEADIILFADARHDLSDWQFKRIRHHPLARRYPAKCFVYCMMDQPWCGFPGLYTCMPRSALQPQRQRACAYLGLGNTLVAEGSADVAGAEPDLLFSFIGRNCHSVRGAVLALSHRRAEVSDSSRVDFFNGGEWGTRDARERYAAVMGQSKFVLCPRGSGTASFRLFETLAAGRVPVIISDDWVPVDGPDWAVCSVRVAERDVGGIPALLERLERRWEAMAVAARQAWAEHFAPDVIWHRMIESIADIRRTRGVLPERVRRHLPDRRYARLWLRHAKHRALRTVRGASDGR